MQVLKVDTSTSSYLLASSVPCIALFSLRELASTSPVHPNPWNDTLCHHKPPYIFPKKATIPTYQGISIAFPKYIATQHPPSHDLIFMSYMFLLHWQRHTFAYIMIATYSLC